MKCLQTEEWGAVVLGSLWCLCRRLPTDCCIDEKPIWEQDIDFCYEGQTLGSISITVIKLKHLCKHAFTEAFVKDASSTWDDVIYLKCWLKFVCSYSDFGLRDIIWFGDHVPTFVATKPVWFPIQKCAPASMWHNSFVLCFTGSHISSPDRSAMKKSGLSFSPVDKIMAKINGKDLVQILIKRNNCWYKWCFQYYGSRRAEHWRALINVLNICILFHLLWDIT